MSLDLTSLKDAIHSLDQLLKKTTDDEFMNTLDQVTRQGLIAGAIQNFEFTYELSWKFIERWLKENTSVSKIEGARTRKDVFRLAAQNGLINDPLPWFKFTEARNLTSHTYNLQTSREVYQHVLLFIDDAKKLLQSLERLND